MAAAILRCFGFTFLIFFTVYGLERDGPFSQDCGDGLTVISIVDPQKFFIFELKKIYIYNTILFIILPLHQITKKLMIMLMWGCF